MDLIEEYIENLNNMKLSPDDYGDKKKVRKYNKLCDRNRKIATLIECAHTELKERFSNLLIIDDDNTKLWVAHHMLEVMTFDYASRMKALEIIEFEAKYCKDETVRLGNKMWLENYYNTHPEDCKK